MKGWRGEGAERVKDDCHRERHMTSAGMREQPKRHGTPLPVPFLSVPLLPSYARPGYLAEMGVASTPGLSCRPRRRRLYASPGSASTYPVKCRFIGTSGTRQRHSSNDDDAATGVEVKATGGAAAEHWLGGQQHRLAAVYRELVRCLADLDHRVSTCHVPRGALGCEGSRKVQTWSAEAGWRSPAREWCSDNVAECQSQR